MTTITLKSCLMATIASLALLPAISEAAVVGLADLLNQTGTYSQVDALSISGEESVYIVGTMTFDTVDTSGTFNVVEVGVDGDDAAYQWGQQFSGTAYDFVRPVAEATTLDATLGGSYTVVLKINQTTGDYSLWLDPDLSMTEDSNTSLFDGTGGPSAEIQQIRRRGGNTPNNSGVVDYTGFSIYTTDDTPFALPTIPEPSAFILAMLSIIGLSVRRQRRVRS